MASRNIVEHPPPEARARPTRVHPCPSRRRGGTLLQAALLDFRARLPERYRGDNERIADIEEGAPR